MEFLLAKLKLWMLFRKLWKRLGLSSLGRLNRALECVGGIVRVKVLLQNEMALLLIDSMS